MENSDAILELKGHKYGDRDDGAPLMCNLFCQDMGRHVHIDFCRAEEEGACSGQDVKHITDRMHPEPEKSKDWITHELFWKRSGTWMCNSRSLRHH